VTLEEQMICGALQTLNEEACEDVLDESIETKRRLSVVSNAQDPGELHLQNSFPTFYDSLHDSHSYTRQAASSDIVSINPTASPVSDLLSSLDVNAIQTDAVSTCNTESILPNAKC